MTDPLWWGAGGALLGAIIGSFLATLILRWPAGRDMGGRSVCDGCGMTLPALAMVPIASFLVQGGRCRQCGARVAPLHIAVELLCALVAGFALWRFPGWPGLAGAMFGWLLVALAALDLLHFWLPDRLTAALALLGLTGGAAGLSPALGDRLIGGAAGFALLWAIGAGYQAVRGREGLGAGDPKLFGAIGLWLGWQVLPFVLLGASAAGLGAALVLALRGRVSADTRLPLGTLMAAAAFPLWLYPVI